MSPGGGFSPEFDFDETKPAGTTLIQDGDNWNRSNQQHISNCLAVEHYEMSDDPDASEDDFGRHDFITLKEQAAKPDLTGSTTRHGFYTKADGLYFEKDDGTEVLLIAFDTDQVPTESIEQHDIPSGEILLFEKDTAVSGYTLQTNVDDKLCFISKGSVAGGETGAGNHSTGTWTQPDHVHQWLDHIGAGNHQRSYTSAGSEQNLSESIYNAGSEHIQVTNGANAGVVGGTESDLYTKKEATANTWRPAALVFTRQKRD